jgi:hypothetical protein
MCTMLLLQGNTSAKDIAIHGLRLPVKSIEFQQRRGYGCIKI